MIKYIIFDFDGVIADSFGEAEAIFHELRQKHGLLNRFRFKDIKTIGARAALKKTGILAPWILWKIRNVQKNMAERLYTVNMIKGMKSVITKLADKYKLGILTSNLEENVHKFMLRNNIMGYFQFIHSQRAIFGKHKVMKKILRKYRLQTYEVVYIGDEDRDVQSMKLLDIKTISVTWGYNSEIYLKTLNPNYVATTPNDILRFIKGIDKNDK